MILEMLVNLFFGIVNFVLGLIPTFEFGGEFSAFFSDATFLVSLASYFLPIPTILACLGVMFVVDNIKFIVSIFNWIISKIPTIN